MSESITSAPIIKETDLLILGGSTAAVEAALIATAAGKSVTLATGYTYLGEDICAPMNYWFDKKVPAETELTKKLFGSYYAENEIPSPMHIKYTLEQELIESGLELIYSSYPTHLLRDNKNLVSGAIIANRSGFQAIKAKTIIDATERGTLARLSTADFKTFEAGEYDIERVIVTKGDVPDEGKELPTTVTFKDGVYKAYTNTIKEKLADASIASLNRADVASKVKTWDCKQIFVSDKIYINSADRMVTGATTESAHNLNINSFKCEENLYTLNTYADLSDSAAKELVHPAAFALAGKLVGEESVKSVEARADISDLKADYAGNESVKDLEIVRKNKYFRFEDKNSIELDLSKTEIFGEYDVAVSGGGTAGAPAGIAAGRAGSTAVVCEALPCLGGVSTEGQIGRYWHGSRGGFTKEIGYGVFNMGPDAEFGPEAEDWDTEWKKGWYLKEEVAAGTDVWFQTITIAVAMSGNSLKGMVVASPYGVGLIKSKNVVDCSGNADVAAAAGGEVVNIAKDHVAVQGTGLSPKMPGVNYINTDHTFADDTDVLDTTRAFVNARCKYTGYYDLSQMLNSRQRQQIEGDLKLDPLDFLANRTYPDTVITARSNFDSHGFTIHPVFMAQPPTEEGMVAHVPYRALIPKGLDGVLVTGLGVSAHRDALPVIRMQPDVQNQGYAAGYAAAIAAQKGLSTRDVNVRDIQKHFVEIGILEEEVLTHEDSFPLSDDKIADAAKNGIDSYLGLAIIFGEPNKSIPLMIEEYDTTADYNKKLRYAHLLGLLGNDTGIDTIIEYLDNNDWDTGWDYRGMGQFGYSLSEIDTMLVALGYAGNKKALPTMLKKLETLGSDELFSHYRALTIAFEAMPTPEAAPKLAEYLETISGKASATVLTMKDTTEDTNDCKVDTNERNRELRELLIARGLYACGDKDGVAAKVLKMYSKDLHGHYARHARALLAK